MTGIIQAGLRCLKIVSLHQLSRIFKSIPIKSFKICFSSVSPGFAIHCDLRNVTKTLYLDTNVCSDEGLMSAWETLFSSHSCYETELSCYAPHRRSITVSLVAYPANRIFYHQSKVFLGICQSHGWRKDTKTFYLDTNVFSLYNQ